MFFNKKGWKKFNVRISARVKGTVKEIAEYPVNNSIEDVAEKGDDNLSAEQIKTKSVLKDIKIDNYKSEWRHVKEAKGNLFIPAITFYLKNSGIKEVRELKISASFEFDDKKGVISQWKGKKGIIINLLSKGAVSEKIYFEAENGIKATSVEKLFLNRAEWKDIIVKIYIGTKNIKATILKIINVEQNVKGYKVREKAVL
jgi:hypothetical protein